MFRDDEWVLPNPAREKEEEEAKKRRNPFRAIHHLLFDQDELQACFDENPGLQDELQPLYAKYIAALLRETGIHLNDLETASGTRQPHQPPPRQTHTTRNQPTHPESIPGPQDT